MIKRIKNKLIKWLLSGRIKPSYDDFSYKEKVKCDELWRNNEGLMKKTVKIIIGSVIQEYALNNKEVEFARNILTLQNDLIEEFHNMVEKEMISRSINPDL